MSKGISEAQAETRLMSRMPAENPYPEMRISEKGDLLYANGASAELTKSWGGHGGHPVADDLRKWAMNAMKNGVREVHEFTTGERTFAGTFVPIGDAGF